MTTDHSYRSRMTAREALDRLVEGKGTQFCPVAIDAFVNAIEKTLEEERADEENTETSEPEAAAGSIAEPAQETGEKDVTLYINSPDGFGEVRRFKKCIEKYDGLKIALESWSETDGYIIIVSAQKPMDLPEVFKNMPMVEKVSRVHNSLTVSLKTPVERKVFDKGFSLV